MNNSFEALEQFINDYSLTIQDGTTAFPATVHIRLNGHLKIIASEIQIITSDNLGTVYILNLNKTEEHLPDMFEAKKSLFSYSKGAGLKISGSSDGDNFIISISPK